jgi:hypothetical protein
MPRALPVPAVEEEGSIAKPEVPKDTRSIYEEAMVIGAESAMQIAVMRGRVIFMSLFKFTEVVGDVFF